jgi:preprotein translocase subunit SecD
MTINELLVAADPVSLETSPPPERRSAIRRKVVGAVLAGPRQKRELSRRMVVLAVGIATLLVAVALSPAWMGGAATLHAAMQFEVRLAGEEPKPGVRRAADPTSGRTIYLDQEVVLTNRDIAATRVVTLPSGFGVEVQFTDGGAAKLRAGTVNNLGRQLAVIVDGKVLAAPTIRSAVSQLGVMSGPFTREEAERLAGGIRSIQ